MSSTRDRNLEEKIVQLLVAHKAKDSVSADLSSLLKEPNARVCVQGSYLFQDDFEKFAGRDAPGFEYLEGKGYGLWFFYQDGSAAWVFIEAGVMSYFAKKGPPCTTGVAKPTLMFALQNGVKKFYLSEI